MAEKKRGLGRPLDAILGAATMTDAAAPSIINTPTAQTTAPPAPAVEGQVCQLPVEYLQRGKYQPRGEIDPEGLDELADSIRAQGIIQPILVRKLRDNQYEIVAGERRWRAAQLADMAEVPVIIRDFSDEATMAVSLIENIQRENLNPIEEAKALQRLLDECRLTHQAVAKAVGRSRTAVTNLLRLLSLDPQVMTFVERGDLEMGHARALLALSPENQKKAAAQIIANRLSVRETERFVKNFGESLTIPPRKTPDAQILALEQRLSDRIMAKVAIQQNEKGRGKIVIRFNNQKMLDKIIDSIEQ